MSTETSTFIRDGDKGGGGGGGGEGGRKSEGSIAGANMEDRDAAERRRNNKMLRQCPLRHCAATSVPRSYCPNCCAVTKTMSVTPLLGNNWRKSSPTVKPSSASLLLISSGLTWGSSSPPSSWSRLDSDTVLCIEFVIARIVQWLEHRTRDRKV